MSIAVNPTGTENGEKAYSPDMDHPEAGRREREVV
jgi:hypothetical protein